VDPLEFESPKIEPRSAEYCTYVLEAKQTGSPFKLQGNVRNDGYITNLPMGSCVEVPVYVDEQGLNPLRVGALPHQLAALNHSNVTVQTLAGEGSLEGDPELIMQAMAMDPLTSACCTLRETREMAAEMLEAEKEWLPHFEGKKLRPTPKIDVPKDVKRADVPLDPALAIGKRFMTLIEQQTD
jgi:alpha-galactosidase